MICGLPNPTTDSVPTTRPAVTKRNRRSRIPKGAFRSKSLSVYLDLSEASLHRLDASGLLPKAIRLAGCKLWSRRTIDFWLSLNCPPRDEFEQILASRKAGRR